MGCAPFFILLIIGREQIVNHLVHMVKQNRVS
ncbi:hypothetical protein IX326_000470 [Porphyromonas levii]|nr:hypothetical protein [Porphyromonas levii]